MKRAVFLDRDGVINAPIFADGRSYPPKTLKEFKLIPGVKEALETLHQEGFLLILTTNQPDVGRGTQKREIVEAMHQKLRDELPFTDIEVCFDDSLDTYKPKPGMLLNAAKKHNIDLRSSFMVGDRWRDVDAGTAAGCSTIFIDLGYKESLNKSPDHICDNLLESVPFILQTKRVQ
ncbi:MAG: D-glycero-alpha-D-manno-heptose-1,7-bisphosphate 7-phosphatase [Chlamydiia bacterium]|nr:D-glycero-alpha-D-manno-heptose-1,7-bisphosphate 7-phosphatase [Chlamydiia bacterium]MCH9616411.1 D-glycero-alpha-D-manno-heptose-1,7-bisphosphate 7-phosphatase [Chlamydiia bacterium]MCH9629603.1 D-glycero-alpha-D-manno-heptose-1,7-bisphosphate 7-phosphatase [Chlamydiia bacterium]